MKNTKFYDQLLTIQIEIPNSGWTDYVRLSFTSEMNSEKRFYDLCEAYLRKFPNIQKMRGLLERYSDHKLLDKFAISRDDL